MANSFYLGQSNIDVVDYGTLRAILKCMSRPESAAVKDIDIDIPIFWVRNIDIGNHIVTVCA